jgi:hypothetical protein
MGSFLKLEDCLALAPFPAIIAVLMVLGIHFLGTRAVQKLKIDSSQTLHLAECLAGPQEFLEGKRNPWNRKGSVLSFIV